MHQTRKIIAVGRSSAVIIPPHIMDHLHASKGDLLLFDNRYPNFCLLVKVVVPPFKQISLDFPDLLDPDAAPGAVGPDADGQSPTVPCVDTPEASPADPPATAAAASPAHSKALTPHGSAPDPPPPISSPVPH